MEIPGSFVGIERASLTVGGQKIVLVIYDGFENRLLLEKLGHLKKEKCICFFDICMRILDMRRDDLEADTLEFICAECPCAKGILDGQVPQVRNHIKFLEKGSALRSVIGIEVATAIDVPPERDIGKEEKRKVGQNRQASPKSVVPKEKNVRKNGPGSDSGIPAPTPDEEEFVFTGGDPVYRIVCGNEDITSSCKVDLADPEKIKEKAKYLRMSVVGIRLVEYSEEFPEGKGVLF